MRRRHVHNRAGGEHILNKWQVHSSFLTILIFDNYISKSKDGLNAADEQQVHSRYS